MIYKIAADPNCKACYGSGTVYDTVPYGSTTAQMPSTCSCVEEQLPEGFNDMVDEVKVEEAMEPVVKDGPEFEYDDYLDLYN